MTATDSLLARYQTEAEERSTFMDGVVEAAEKEGRDLNSQEMELLTRTRERIKELNEQIEPLREAALIARQSRDRTAVLADEMRLAAGSTPGRSLEYRSAGDYVLDYWRAKVGVEDAKQRLDLWHRAAAHQTTGDNPGLIPEQILGPVVNFIDAARPLIGVLGARGLPGGSWSRPQIVQHTAVAPQSAEKGELTSRKMTINKLPVAPQTIGGYVNVSRQDIDWSQPAIMDLVISDLAAQYAIETEQKVVTDLVAAAVAGPVIPTGAVTAAAVAAAFWTAAASVYTATKGVGGVFAVAGPDMLGTIGPAFPPVNPQNGQGTGFNAGNFSQGLVGSVSGIPTYVTAGMPVNTMLVLSGAACEVYEDRLGALQVIEPSVLGVQVAYAGYFADLILLAAGVVKVTKTP